MTRWGKQSSPLSSGTKNKKELKKIKKQPRPQAYSCVVHASF